jgi:hypothetical protein
VASMDVNMPSMVRSWRPKVVARGEASQLLRWVYARPCLQPPR